MAAVWPRKYAAYLRNTLRVQASHDALNLPRIWFWKFDVDSSPQDHVYNETPKINRRYFGPFGVHVYVAWHRAKGPTRQGLDKDYVLTCGVTRAELLRVRMIVDHKQTFEYQLPKTAEDIFKINSTIEPYLFRPGDMFQWDNQLYDLNDVILPQFRMGPTDYTLTWEGIFNTTRKDATDLEKPVALMQTLPPQVALPMRLAADG